jgi:cyclic pyranopterin phosphate synthase
MPPMIVDALNRPPLDLRISVTDKCNYRCSYCMPLSRYEWVDRREILSYEEITRLARIFVGLGVEKIRLTGGEPLLRRDLDRLITALSRLEGLKDLSITTNGSLLVESARQLAAAGLKRINVSLDTLDPDKFERITRRRDLDRILEGLFLARAQGMDPVKINTVVERGVNDDEIVPMVEFARRNGFAVRFIEYMDVGNVNQWRLEKMVPKEEILTIIRRSFRIEATGRRNGSAPSVDYRFTEGGPDIGIIASVTEPFCQGCTRARLTADGRFVTCLFSGQGHDVKQYLREHTSDEVVRDCIEAIWTARKDRYSEERLTALRSAENQTPEVRRKIEMISLGG